MIKIKTLIFFDKPKCTSTPQKIITTAVTQYFFARVTICTQTIFPLVIAFTPVMAASADKALSTPADSHISVSTTPENDEIERWIAGGASGLASSLKSQGAGQYALSQARSQAGATSSAAVLQWLSQFGTARVQLGMDDRFSLGESAADVLIPLYDNQKSMLFTQVGGRRKDQRLTLNAGVGVRLFSDRWMYGVNTFLDNDFTGYNRRISLGAEVWTDYLKLSANTYFGITDWHQSRDFDDYDERPADGFDITANAYLPMLPQLGTKVKYEQYQGDGVALIDQETRQKNPNALTLGLHYTPIPLVTLSKDYRKSGNNDSLQVNVQFTYIFGMPWERHISSAMVGAKRTLAGSRLELVERNNNIVLDYRKQELVKLTLPELIHGPAASLLPLNAAVVAKHGLKHIEWQTSPEFSAAGGQVVVPSPEVYQVKLPTRQASGTNQYEVTAVAWDRKGNASKPVHMSIVVDRPSVDALHSTWSLDSTAILPADGRATRKVILKAHDSNDNLISGLALLIHVSGTFTAAQKNNPAPPSPAEALAGAHISSFDETSPGVYEATLTAGQIPGELLLTADIDNVKLTQLKVVLGEIEHRLGTPQILTLQPVADGTTWVDARISVTDKDGNQTTNETFIVSIDGIPQEVTTDANSEITVKLPPETVPGEHTFAVSSEKSSVDIKVIFGPGEPDAVHTALSSNVATLLADGMEKALITLVLKDKYNNPLPGKMVLFTATPAVNVQFGTVTDHLDGSYSVELVGSQPGQISLSATEDSLPVATRPLVISLTQQILQITRAGVPLQGSPVVGDILSASSECNDGSSSGTCSQLPVAYQWEVETAPGSGVYTGIRGATSNQYRVTADLQKKRIRVSAK
jgi:adhesin/invasin